MKLFFSFLFAIFIFSTTQLRWARADLSASYITISPGPELFSAFGHAAILIEDKKDATKTKVYEFKGVTPAHFKQTGKSVVNSTQFLRGKSSSQVVQSSYDTFKARYEPIDAKPTANKIKIDGVDNLHLSQNQIAALEKELSNAVSKGTYTFDSLHSNCATEAKERIFIVLDPPNAEKKRLSNEKAKGVDGKELTYRDILKAALEDAIKIHGSVRFPTEFFADNKTQAFLIESALKAYGIPVQMKKGADFDTAVNTLDELAQKLQNDNDSLKMFSLDKAEFKALADAIHDFNTVELNKTMNEYDSMMVPARVKKLINDKKVKNLAKNLLSK